MYVLECGALKFSQITNSIMLLLFSKKKYEKLPEHSNQQIDQ